MFAKVTSKNVTKLVITPIKCYCKQKAEKNMYTTKSIMYLLTTEKSALI